MSRKTVIINGQRDQRVIVGEHSTDVYLAVEHSAAFLNPLDAMRAGFALLDAAAGALERQFQRQHSDQSAATGRRSAAGGPLPPSHPTANGGASA